MMLITLCFLTKTTREITGQMHQIWAVICIVLSSKNECTYVAYLNTDCSYWCGPGTL